jgi:hypothetical protein
VPLLSCSSRRAWRALVALAGLVLLVGCQVKVQVDTKVNADGSGTVTVSVGLDADALRQVGDLRSQLRVSDLTAAGWTVSGPTRDRDGYTWVRATKPFADAAQATEVMDEVNGSNGAFREWTVSHSSSTWSSTWKVTGTVDLSKGMQTFSDPKLDQALGANGYDALVRQIEQREGKPVSQMVDVQVSVEVPGAARVYTPSLADHAPTQVHVSHTQVNRTLGLVVVVIGLALVVLAAVLVRWRLSARRMPPARHAR